MTRCTYASCPALCRPSTSCLQRRSKTWMPGTRPGMTERLLCRPCQRAVDHRNRVLQSINRDERAEARAFFLTEQHLIEHVEPVERNARPAILAFLHRVQKRLAAADLVDDVLDLFRRRRRPHLRQRIAQI